MGIKVINADGTKGEIELPEGATLDAKGMGMLSNEEVGSFKKKYMEQGKESVADQLKLLGDEKSALIEQINSLKTGFDEKENATVQQSQQLSQLQQSLEDLKSKYEKEQEEKAKIAFREELRGTVDGVSLIPNAFDILTQHVEKKKVDGGFMNAEGSTVEMKDAVSEWLQSDIGKALVVSKEKGGGGTTPNTIGGETFETYYKSGKSAEYMQKYGKEKFETEMMAMKGRVQAEST